MHIDPPSNILARWKLTRDDGTDMKPELARFSAMTGLERKPSSTSKLTSSILTSLANLASSSTMPIAVKSKSLRTEQVLRKGLDSKLPGSRFAILTNIRKLAVAR